MASRRADARGVVVGAQTVGLLVAVVLAPLLPGAASGRALAWGAVSGVLSGLGVLSLYQGFTRGRVAVVAPVSAVLAAGLPVVFGAVGGERPAGPAVVGLLFGLVAIALVSRPAGGDERDDRAAGLWFAVGAGVGFAGLFVALSLAGDDAGVWPLLTSRLAAMALVGTLAVAGGVGLGVARPARRPTAAAGLLGALGNAAFLLAVQQGLLSVVAVVTSLYPAATVILARIVLEETIGRVQLAGLIVALVAVSLIALG